MCVQGCFCFFKAAAIAHSAAFLAAVESTQERTRRRLLLGAMAETREPEVVALVMGILLNEKIDVRESHLVCEKLAQTQRLLGVEIVELNPILDDKNKTGRLAVWLILSALGKSIL